MAAGWYAVPSLMPYALSVEGAADVDFLLIRPVRLGYHTTGAAQLSTFEPGPNRSGVHEPGTMAQDAKP